MRNGLEMPRLGLGVWKAAKGKETRDAVACAFEAGYRHVDTASMYGNEADVGSAVRECGLPREEIFITTKLWNSDQGYEQALKAFQTSLSKLRLDFIDLYLIHWPVAGLRLKSWRALEKLHREGLVRSIGVSNFMVNHLTELKEFAETPPAVNQIELHPFNQQPAVVDWCAKNEIVVQAYSPLMRGFRLNHPAIVDVAKSTGRTEAQVVLRWLIQKNLVVLPKSTTPHRIVENSRIFDFELNEEAVRKLNILDESHPIGWDPRGIV
jgi:diketogulonate reductase-like aldo/keto reductase